MTDRDHERDAFTRQLADHLPPSDAVPTGDADPDELEHVRALLDDGAELVDHDLVEITDADGNLLGVEQRDTTRRTGWQQARDDGEWRG